MKFVIALVAALFVTTSAMAQHSHGHAERGPNGGLLEDVAGVHAELVAKGNSLTLNIFDEAMKPVPASGYTASALIVNGSERETLTLTAGDKALTGETKNPVRAASTVTVTLRTPAGKSGQARFRQ